MAELAPRRPAGAGGTGGHMFPAEALAGELEARGVPFALVTDRAAGSGRARCRPADPLHPFAPARSGSLGRSLMARAVARRSACSMPGAALGRIGPVGRRRLRRLRLGADHDRRPPAPACRPCCTSRTPCSAAPTACVPRGAARIATSFARTRRHRRRRSPARARPAIRCASRSRPLRGQPYPRAGRRPSRRSAGVRRQPGRARRSARSCPRRSLSPAGDAARAAAHRPAVPARGPRAGARSLCRGSASWPSWRRSSPTAAAPGRRPSGDRPLRRLDRRRARCRRPAVDPGALSLRRRRPPDRQCPRLRGGRRLHR